MILNAIFPAPVRFVPKGARNARLGFFREVVSVEIPEISRAETRSVQLESLQDHNGAMPLLSHAGSLWKPLGLRGVDAGRDDLAALIEDRPGPSASGDLRSWIATDLVRTPLGALVMARDTYRFPSGLTPVRGVPRVGIRHTLSDGTEEASVSARSYAESTFLLVDGHAHARVVPLGWVTAMESSVHSGLWVDVSLKRVLGGLLSMPATPGTISTVEQTFDAAGPTRRTGGMDAWSDLPAHVFGDAAAEAVANALPGAVRHCLVRGLDCEPDLLDELSALEVRGLTMSIRGPALASALDAAARGCDVVCQNLDSERGRYLFSESPRDGWEQAARVVRDVLLPDLGRRAQADVIDPEDEAALAGIGFGP